MKNVKSKPKKEEKEKNENQKDKQKAHSLIPNLKNDIENALIKPNDLKRDHYMKALIYGAPGCGKSHLSIATKLKAFVICTEYKQTQATYNHVKKLGKMNPDTVLYEADTMKKLRKVLKYLKTVDHDYELIVLDHIGNLQKIIKKYYIRHGKSRMLKIPNMAEWQALIDSTLEVITAFRDLPNTHFLTLAHMIDTSSEEAIKIKPKIQGKNLYSDIAGAMNLVGYMTKEVNDDDIERDVWFLTDSSVTAKDHHCLNNIEPAELDYWIAKWKGDIDRTVRYEEWLETY
jgi:hypothetical protein